MNKTIDNLIKVVLDEDLGKLGDITSMALFDEMAIAEGLVVSHSSGIFSGAQVLRRCFYLYDHTVVVKLLLKDGDEINKGQELAQIKGRIRSLLAVERTALNFITHLSGIAAQTRLFVETLKDTDCRLRDTRKTIPGLRALEKAAVKHGSGNNHRFGLYDGILIKDNHLKKMSITEAVKLCKAKYPDKEVEVEVENYDQVAEALAAGVDVIMLDNMDINQIKQSVELVGRVLPARQCLAQAGGRTRRIKTEASGTITQQNIGQIAQTGVDYISTSAITTGARPLDFSFEISM